ncbi:LacI family DNA-binding transcriptional regulator [Streptomyces decoyicus]|uniref:LacI family DNA-binding transcriptional regulator n=1 Tax=Streptomyces decoyicus TaxID=249567 RepID=UPI0036643BB0
MVLTAEQRRARILEIVRELGTVRVVDLAARLGLSAVTTRRDIVILADDGLVHRSHGAVSLPSANRVGPARTLTVGVLVPTVSSYFDEVLTGARTAAANKGAHLILGIAPYGSGSDQDRVQRLLDSGADGLMLTPNWRPGCRPEDCAWITEIPVPVVLVERRPDAGSATAVLDSVGTDHRHGVLRALRHLVSLGHDDVLLAARHDTWTAHQIRVGYTQAAPLLGLGKQPVFDISEDGGDAERLADWVAEGASRGVRAVLVHNDQDAIQLPALLRARGLRVPEDIALVSYDDIFAALAAPPLTAVGPPKRAVGAAALDLLVRRIEAGPALPVHHLELLPHLTVRTSCGGAAQQR